MQEETTRNRLYFPNLNGLRALGASVVMIDHIEFLKPFFGLTSYSWFPVSGKIGVTLFFALSGFLITSLLLTEKKTLGTIDLKKFYLRRVLRILPLYYLVVFLSIFVFSHIGILQIPGYTDRMFRDLSWTNILLILFLIPNITNFYIPYADQRWSIIVEEQFYLVQPFILKLVKHSRTLLSIFLLIIFSPELISFTYKIFGLSKFVSPNFINAFAMQLKYLSCIAVGCLFSILFFKKDSSLKNFLFHKTIQWGVLLFLLICIITGHFVYKTSQLIDYRLYSLLFAIVVLNATQNNQNIFKLERNVPNFLGKISYGIYMYHPVCIGISIWIAGLFSIELFIQNLIIYVFSIGLTIIISWLSFTYFEQSFLKLKPRTKISKQTAKPGVIAETPIQTI